MIQLKRGREKSVKRRHPWIFSGAIDNVSGKPKSGETAEVRSASGEVLARAAFSPQSQIRARVWTFEPADGGTSAVFDFRPRVEKPGVKQLSPLLKSLFRWNHRWAMRRGERGVNVLFARGPGRRGG